MRSKSLCGSGGGNELKTDHWSPTVLVSTWLPETVRDRGSKQNTLNDDFYHTTCSSAAICFSPNFVDWSVPYEAKQRRVKFWLYFGNIPLVECNVSVPKVRSSGTELKAPVTDYWNRDSGNHTRG